MVTQRPIYHYLPEFYRQDPLLDRLCGVLEEQYAAIGREIDGLDRLYDPNETPEDFLLFLGRLVGLQEVEKLLTPSQLRALIPIAQSLQRRKGTRAALAEVLHCVTQTRCGHPVQVWIFEYEDRHKMPPALSELFHELPEGDRDVTVLIGPEPTLWDVGERTRLEMLARAYAPAFASLYLAVIPVCTTLDSIGFLGYNTWL